MEIIQTKQEIYKRISGLRESGHSIGLVPTMGALHDGHASLVSRARRENDTVVVSIFVNPAQFNDPEDLKNYPRREKEDLSLLEKLNVDLVFMPDVAEMYPEPDGDRRVFDLYPLDTVMEGKYRKNHFNGVARIVSKLFEALVPDRAYFGQKDFQQLVIIKKLVSLMNYSIQIVECPTVREPDGLAMSSRNLLLTVEERKLAPFIFETLERARHFSAGHTPGEVIDWVKERFRNREPLKLEYFEIVDDTELKTVKDWDEKSNKVGCIAVHLGKIRLIDNIIFN